MRSMTNFKHKRTGADGNTTCLVERDPRRYAKPAMPESHQRFWATPAYFIPQ